MARRRFATGESCHYNIFAIEDVIVSYSFGTTTGLNPRLVTGPYSEHLKLTLAGPLVVSVDSRLKRCVCEVHGSPPGGFLDVGDDRKPEWIGSAEADRRNEQMTVHIWIPGQSTFGLASLCHQRRLKFALLWGPGFKYRKAMIRSIELEHQVNPSDY